MQNPPNQKKDKRKERTKESKEDGQTSRDHDGKNPRLSFDDGDSDLLTYKEKDRYHKTKEKKVDTR